MYPWTSLLSWRLDDPPRICPSGQRHFPSSLRPPGQRIQPKPSDATPWKHQPDTSTPSQKNSVWETTLKCGVQRKKGRCGQTAPTGLSAGHCWQVVDVLSVRTVWWPGLQTQLSPAKRRQYRQYYMKVPHSGQMQVLMQCLYCKSLYVLETNHNSKSRLASCLSTVYLSVCLFWISVNAHVRRHGLIHYPAKPIFEVDRPQGSPRWKNGEEERSILCLWNSLKAQRALWSRLACTDLLRFDADPPRISHTTDSRCRKILQRYSPQGLWTERQTAGTEWKLCKVEGTQLRTVCCRG